MKFLIPLLIIFTTINGFARQSISFTFDDGSISDQSKYSLEEWNSMILDALKSAEVEAAFFVTTQGKQTEKGKYLLNSWDEAGHMIANHTHTHPSFNSDEVTAQDFEKELLRADKIITHYEHYSKLFRFPYLKEGKDPAKVDSIRQIMAQHGYRNGYVTIDASDWYVDSRLRERLKKNPDADLDDFKDYYLEHLYERAVFYDNLAYDMTGRHIKHTILLHHNLAAALFLDDLIAMFISKGWNVISADEAFQDPIFKNTPDYAGESLIWALAKDSGKYDELLRYPGEDSKYIKEEMDKLGLLP